MKARLRLPLNSSLHDTYNGKIGEVTFLRGGRAKVSIEMDGHTDQNSSIAILHVPVTHIEVLPE